jgi:Zn-dependent peptidase ImmA (M78 family)
MVRFIADPIGGLPWRPYKSEEEMDNECEAFVRHFLSLSFDTALTVPLPTDLLTNMIEEYAERLDLYADLRPDVEGHTEISAHARPWVGINRSLSAASHRINRLRSTLAHELYHTVFHAPFYQEKFKQGDLFAKAAEHIVCTRDTILASQKLARVDWREWQAAYGAGALLIPITMLRQVVHEHSAMHGLPPYLEGSENAQALVATVASFCEVSQESVVVRLKQKGVITASLDKQQLGLFIG